MSCVSVVGLQWGDEGKGKIIDVLASKVDIVARFHGGSNAGHTVQVGDSSVKLSVLPSSVLRKNVVSVIGNGVVLDLPCLIKELDSLKSSGREPGSKDLIIANNAHLILSIHRAIDASREEQKSSSCKIGTTGKGIGPCYEDKIARRGIRICDMFFPEVLAEKADNIINHHNIFLRNSNLPEFSREDVLNELIPLFDVIKHYVGRVSEYLYNAIREGKRVMFEGAQGVMLDYEHGTYPFVTSSSALPANAWVGTGAGFKDFKYILGVAKAYCTRVGNGPFPTEMHDEIGDEICKRGAEFGTVSGRKRRCGWFDAVAVKQAIRISGVSCLVITKIDILDFLDTVNVCVSYEYDGQKLDYLPASVVQNYVKPVYIQFEGWKSSTKGLKRGEDLPKKAVSYIHSLSEILGVPIKILSTGPDRSEVIYLENLD